MGAHRMDAAAIEITPAVTHGLLSGSPAPLLLDCRTAEEHSVARIAGAVLIPMQELPGRLAEIEAWRGKPIVVHCHHGMRSLKVARWLREQGFARAQSMLGGIDAWSTEIDPSVPRY
jgi:rhodanese-related sulfurtransferase